MLPMSLQQVIATCIALVALVSLSSADVSCGPTFSNVFQPNCCAADDIRDFDTVAGRKGWYKTGLSIDFQKSPTPYIHIQCQNEYGCDVVVLELCLHDPNKAPEEYKKINRDCIYQLVDVQGYNNGCTIRDFWIGYHRLINCNVENFSLASGVPPTCPPKQ
ncbi:uncharacterized protein J3D65DRAFT_634628 [Phyllosticta citribraziliensis]|uniref:Uncharacterized protein n=1 Tax=Phyllosticta citribraziliensis TaxID=989973 RepID=A0ABR1LHH9_9PEZI